MSGECGGHSMTWSLRRVMVCRCETAGWCMPANSGGWKDLGFLRPPDAGLAARQHGLLAELLARSGCEVVELNASLPLGLDSVYTHDPSFVTDAGAVILRMGKESRSAEPEAHRRLYSSLGVPILGELRPPATAEAGDLLWLDPATLLAGRGYRTNAPGIDSLRRMLGPFGIEVFSAPLPHGQGPAACLHLMSLVSLLDDSTALVDLPSIAVETAELLQDRGYRFVEIVEQERETLACNVLALGDGRLLAFEENAGTNARLRERGFEVWTFPGSEIGINGGGGPTCLTRPLLRR